MAKASYKVIKGKNHDRKLVDLAESAVKGKKDGLISLGDSKKFLTSVKDAGIYTDIEKRTIRYIRDNYKFTKEADKWFRAQIEKWVIKKEDHAKKIIRSGKEKQKKFFMAGTVKKQNRSRASGKSQPVPPKMPVQSQKQVIKPTPKTTPIIKSAKDGKPIKSPTKQIKSLPKTVQSIQPAVTKNLIESPAVKIGAIAKVPTKTAKPDTGFLTKKVVITAVVIGLILILGIIFFQNGEDKIQEEPKEQDIITEEKKEIVPIAEKKEELKPLDNNFLIYTVTNNDILADISKKFLGKYSRWDEIYKANQNIIQDPNLIYPGQKLKVPKNAEER